MNKRVWLSGRVLTRAIILGDWLSLCVKEKEVGIKSRKEGSPDHAADLEPMKRKKEEWRKPGYRRCGMFIQWDITQA